MNVASPRVPEGLPLPGPTQGKIRKTWRAAYPVSLRARLLGDRASFYFTLKLSAQ